MTFYQAQRPQDKVGIVQVVVPTSDAAAAARRLVIIVPVIVMSVTRVMLRDVVIKEAASQRELPII